MIGILERLKLRLLRDSLRGRLAGTIVGARTSGMGTPA